MKVKKLNTLKTSQYLNMYQIEYEDKKGRVKNWQCFSRKEKKDYEEELKNKDLSPDAVLMAVYHKDMKKLIMIKQYRVCVNAKVIEMPAGLVEKGEDPKKAMERELKEETGLDLVEISRTWKKQLSSGGMTDESFNLYFVVAKGDVSKDYLEDSEDIEVLALSQDQCKDLLFSEEYFDSKAMFLIELYRRCGEKIFYEENK